MRPRRASSTLPGSMLALNLSRLLLPGRGALLLSLSTGGLSLLAAGTSYARFEKPIVDAGKRWLRTHASAAHAAASASAMAEAPGPSGRPGP